MIYISLDPGLNDFGVAVWGEKGELLSAFLAPVASGDWFQKARSVVACIQPRGTYVICEVPQVYERPKSKGNPNILVEIALVVSATVAMLEPCSVQSYRPAQWKGNLPKSVTEERCKMKLSNRELDTVKWPRPSLRHNVWDAISIGLHFLEKQQKIRDTRK